MAGARPGGGSGRWIQRLRRRLRQWRGEEPRTRVQIRCERRNHGGWWICPQAVRDGDVVYAFGVGGDLGFERAMAAEYRARVWAFDPKPDTVEGSPPLPESLRVVPATVDGYDGRRTLVGANGPEDVRVLRLPSVMRMLGHRRLDLLKLDAGGEMEALRDLTGMDVDVRQVLVRFHRGVRGMERERVERTLRGLSDHGYRIFHISPDGRAYSFIRTDVARG